MKQLCSIKLKHNRLLSCLSVCTMCLLIFTSIVIITVISITPIIILGLGEISAGQRDVILYPVKDYFNASKVAELVNEPVMPRTSVPILLNNDDYSMGWFIDFQK